MFTSIAGLGPENDFTGGGPAAIVNGRPVLSSKRAPHIKKYTTV
jgi:hypothetical protein